METATPHRNLFRYPLWLTPEASFIVRRHESVYAILIPLWLQARDLLPSVAVVHGVLMSYNQCALALLCEVPPSFSGSWGTIIDATSNIIDCCSEVDFPRGTEAMSALNDFIKTHPHLHYTETGPLADVLDSETLVWLMEKHDARL